MAASMLLPTLLLMTLSWTGAVHGMGMLMVLEHLAMLTTMLIAMLLRREEYAGVAHIHGSARQPSRSEHGPSPRLVT
jgi:hypothetical protein